MTKAPFADQFVLAVKDQLRHVRYQIRRSARDDIARGAERSGPRAPRPVALAADALFTQLHAAATVLMPEAERKSTSFLFPLPVAAYFGREAADTHAFASEIYYALKGLLRRFGAEEFFVSEQALEDVRSRMEERHGDLVAAALEASGPANERSLRIARICAALAVELSAARPIKELAPGVDAQARPKNLLLSPNAYCAMVVALSIAVMSLAQDEPGLDRNVVLGSADMAVDARFQGLAAALRQRDPIGALAAEFAAMLPFLP